MKIALVQDWLTELGGAEKVFKEIYHLYPESDVFTLVYNDDVVKKLGINPEKMHHSFIQNLPFGKKKYRNYLPLFTKAIESFDLSSYDLIISSSYSVAKGVLTHSNQTHICYCHSPVRYAWDLYHQYLREAKLTKGLKALIVKHYLYKLRIWDIISTNRVDYFISNSNYIKKRIKKVYQRDSITIYPPIEVQKFPLVKDKKDYFITCSRLVPYKKIDLIIETFNLLPHLQLKVIGTGPEMEKIKRIAGKNVEIMGYQPDAVLKKEMSEARAFVFAADEDFGIVPLESIASGTPVIALKKGGTLETVKHLITGIHFESQTIESLTKGIEEFIKHSDKFDPEILRFEALKFDTSIFKNQIKSFISNSVLNV